MPMSSLDTNCPAIVGVMPLATGKLVLCAVLRSDTLS